jgi:glycosyltransferase involved in cell wall biosynthesis
MLIAYDHQIFCSQVYGGISRYFYEIAVRIASSGKFKVRILSPLYVNKYLVEAHAVDVVGKCVPKLPYSTLLMRKLNSPLVGMLLRKHPPDILHETYYSPARLAPRQTVTVVTVYDMIHEKYGEYFSSMDRTAANKRSAVKRADHIICISENTKNDLVDILNVNPAKISVIHLGYTSPSHKTYAPVNLTAVAPYLLYVGQRSGYKNFSHLLEAYSGSQSLRNNFKILCFGGGTLSHDEKSTISRLGLDHDSIIQIAGNDIMLADAYQNAAALVYPSLYEGFGIPILEAMSHGCPAICSNAGSLPEIGGNAASYFDPTDVENIRQAIERVVGSTELSLRMKTDGFARVREFSWGKCADQTCAVYRSLI